MLVKAISKETDLYFQDTAIALSVAVCHVNLMN